MDELNLEVSPQCSQALGDLAAMADTPLKPGETQDNRNKKAEEALVRFQKHFGQSFLIVLPWERLTSNLDQ